MKFGLKEHIIRLPWLVFLLLRVFFLFKLKLTVDPLVI